MQSVSKKRFLFVTTTNLAVNPRLVKELKLACDIGFDSTVVLFRLGNWSDDMTEKIKSTLPAVTFIQLSAIRSPFFPWLVSSVLERMARFVPVTFLNGFFLSGAVDKRSWLLLSIVRKVGTSFDWVVAHNPGAFYPSMLIAKRTRSKLGIDVEDYHPGETNDKKLQSITLKLMQKVLAVSTYSTYASPLIMEEVQKRLHANPFRKFTVLNCFPGNEFVHPKESQGTLLHLVWFSQNISEGRGLELIIPLIEKYHTKMKLHLIGSLNREFDEQYIKGKVGIQVYEPMAQSNLHEFLSEFDAGLATDIPVNINRDIAITNKIIAYAQAGLFIVAMHTTAQDHFLKSSGLQFLQMDNTVTSIEQTLLHLLQLKNNGLISKPKQFATGAEYSWEQISAPLVETWNS